MYIYELPYDVNKELCRLLDNDEDWKELAGLYMQYSPFDINEIEQEARRQLHSPTNQLFIQWGQQNHRVEELFILLHKMKHVPAMRMLAPLVNARFQKLLLKHSSKGVDDKNTVAIDENANRHKMHKSTISESSIPLPVQLIEKGVQMATTSKVFYLNSRSDATSTDSNASSASIPNQKIHDEFMKNVSAVPVLSYEDLKRATNNWSDSNLLGRGGFGHVYKGDWKLLPVAVKRLKDNDGKNRELIREMCLNQYRHDNILPLYGYSLGGPEACLVYQLMAGGSLEQRLRNKTAHPPLSWAQRYQIAHGVARALQYLHTLAGTPLIHGDIKPANILLDQCTMPKIGDFGLARKGPYGEDRTHLKVSRVHGTRPYLPEEYLRSRCLSTSVDVFSFGVVLAEIASALLPLDRTRDNAPLLADYLHVLLEMGVDFANYEDRVLKDSPSSIPHLCREFMILGTDCTKPMRQQRPCMLAVYRRIDAMDFPGKNMC